MEDIRVRAWDKNKKKMFYAGSLSGVGSFYMARYNSRETEEEVFYEKFMIDYKWMLFSGIEDSNRRQIFEGDIIEWSIFPEDGEVRVRDSIVFTNGCFRTKKRCELLATKAPHSQITVIGNIYENPKLLTD